jgi:parallel beta-helix repeat protein
MNRRSMAAHRRPACLGGAGRHLPAARAVHTAVLVAMLLLATAAEASAATLYVDGNSPGCSDTGSGTETQPFCTISAAASKTTAGTTVLVRGGTYAERVNVRSGAAGSPVVFRAADGETVTVRGGTYGFYASAKSWVRIEGFNVEDTLGDGFKVSGGSNNISLIGNRAAGAGEPVSGKTAKGIEISGSSDIRVERNTVVGNSNYGIYLTNSTRVDVVGNESMQNAKAFDRAASGIRLHGSDGNTIASNVSHDNEDSGIELVSGSDSNLIVNNVTYDNGDHGIDVTGTSRSDRLLSNSVYNSVTSGINVEGGSTDGTVVNNIAVDNGINSPRATGNIRVDTASISVGTVVDYNIVNLRASGHNYNWSGLGYATLAQFQAASGQEAHGIQGDPRWVSPSTGNFRLDTGSPAIDSANSGASGQLSTDVAGNPRVDDPSTPNSGAGPRAFDDRGAYEYLLRHLSPTAALTVTPSSGVVDLAVTADASGSTDNDGLSPIESYSFDFGDGSAPVGPQGSATARHTYTRHGTYTVTVTVKDTAGLTATSTKQVTVTNNPPTAVLDVAPASGNAPLLVTADASGSTDTDGEPIESYSFDFGDGSAPVGPQPGATASHTYTAGGTYTVTVTVKDEGGVTSVATREVTVSAGQDDPPTAALEVTPTSGVIDLDVTADASGSTDDDPTSPIASYSFDFGDGSPVVGPQPEATAHHTYVSPGTYTIRVTVRDTLGLSSTRTQDVTVRNDPPSAALAVTPASGLVPLAVTANASGSTDVDAAPIASYAFDFGDGSPVVGPQPQATATHTYNAAGTYTVKVTVTDTLGVSSTATAQVVGTANLVRNPGFETDLSGWNTSGSGAGIALTRETTSHSGGFGAKLANTGTTASTCALNDSPDWARPTSAGTYRGSVWARADTAGATLRLRFREWSGSTLVGTAVSQMALTTSWQQTSVDYTIGSPGSTLDFNAYVTSAAPGTCFYADDAAVFLR